MADIDRISRSALPVQGGADDGQVPHRRRAPRRRHHGDPGRTGARRLLDTSLPTIHAPTLAEAIARNDIKRSDDAAVQQLFRAAPGGVPTQVAFSQSDDALDLDRSTGCIRDKAHAYSQDGGLAVLYGNLARTAASSNGRRG
jgi:dihydroxy-acid dehydratase